MSYFCRLLIFFQYASVLPSPLSLLSHQCLLLIFFLTSLYFCLFILTILLLSYSCRFHIFFHYAAFRPSFLLVYLLNVSCLYFFFSTQRPIVLLSVLAFVLFLSFTFFFTTRLFVLLFLLVYYPLNVSCSCCRNSSLFTTHVSPSPSQSSTRQASHSSCFTSTLFPCTVLTSLILVFFYHFKLTLFPIRKGTVMSFPFPNLSL